MIQIVPSISIIVIPNHSQTLQFSQDVFRWCWTKSFFLFLCCYSIGTLAWSSTQYSWSRHKRISYSFHFVCGKELCIWKLIEFDEYTIGQWLLVPHHNLIISPSRLLTLVYKGSIFLSERLNELNVFLTYSKVFFSTHYFSSIPRLSSLGLPHSHNAALKSPVTMVLWAGFVEDP
jgi:hypothetical protein